MVKYFSMHGRVEEYINTGHDKYVVDPDPDKVYSKRKKGKLVNYRETSLQIVPK